MEAASRRVLVVANRTAGAPLLLEAVRKRADEGPCAFALLIPNEPRKGAADWTLETALPLLSRAAGGPVEGIVGAADPFEAVKLSPRSGSSRASTRSSSPRCPNASPNGSDAICRIAS